MGNIRTESVTKVRDPITGKLKHPPRSRGYEHRNHHGMTTERVDLYTDGTPGRYVVKCDCGWESDVVPMSRAHEIYRDHCEQEFGA